MKIGLYHPFNDLPDNYSLSHVVREQMYMLMEHEHECHFVTSEGFKGDVPEGVVVHAVLPHKEILEAAEPVIEGLDVVFTHDVVYLPVYKKHAVAIREIIGRHPKIRWLHWSHSAPNPSDPREPMPNSIYIGLNMWDLPRLAEQFGVPEAQCRLVYNSVSPDLFNEWHPFTKQVVDKHSLLDCDLLFVFPFDTGRWDAKGGPKILTLVQKLRERKLNAKVVFINAAANTDGRRKNVEDWLRGHEEYAVFTSLEDKQYETVVPRRVVRELMDVGNVFPLLSRSEACSLTMLEAGLKGMIVILNGDFPPFLEFGRQDLVFWMKVSSDRATTNYGAGGEDKYYADAARNLHALYERHSALRFKNRVQKRFNRNWIWGQQLEPLLV